MTRLTPRNRTHLALSPRVRFWLGLILALVLGYLIALAQGFIARPPLVVGQDAVPPARQAVGVTSTLENESGAFINIKPDGEARTLLVYYPGGLVRLPYMYD